jgi:DNA-directed RNA polymerase specialized sigma24 family protein
MAYFARRCFEPQTVADLMSETFVRAAGAFGGFDPGRGSAPAWLFGIAGHVDAGHCEQIANGRDAVARLAGRRALEADEIDELAGKIDAERADRQLIRCCSQLPALERARGRVGRPLGSDGRRRPRRGLASPAWCCASGCAGARTRLRKEPHSDE